MIKVLVGAAVVATYAANTAVGADASGLKPIDPAALQASIEGLAKELMLPGAMVLLSTPQGDVVFGYGTTELGTTNPPRADTHFRAASNTKTMTAASIVQMVQEGKLGFDDPISKYVEGVPDGDEITISQLLKMRSGLFNFTNAPELAEEPRRRSGQGMDRGRGPRHGVQAAARIRAGRRVRIQQHQLLPARPRRREDRRQAALGGLPGPPVRAARHEEHGAAGEPRRTPSPSPTRTATSMAAPPTRWSMRPIRRISWPRPGRATLKPNDDTWQNPSAYFAAGGVISTADDLATWMRALVGGKVFECRLPEAVAGEPRGAGAGRARHAEIRLRHPDAHLGAAT